jgi:hypothetical protein
MGSDNDRDVAMGPAAVAYGGNVKLLKPLGRAFVAASSSDTARAYIT